MNMKISSEDEFLKICFFPKIQMYFAVSFYIYPLPLSVIGSFHKIQIIVFTFSNGYAMVLFLSILKTQLSTTGTNLNNLHVYFQLQQ